MKQATPKKSNIGRFLLVMLTIALGFCLSMGIFFAAVLPAVALDQELRCGIGEHLHADDCYSGDFLVCEQPAHSHDENCYIVLLEDNNINRVLGLIAEGDSLESVIEHTVTNALVFNDELNSAAPQEGGMEQETVAALNATISEEETLPDLTLNEQLNSLSTLEAEQPQQDLSANQGDGAEAAPIIESGGEELTEEKPLLNAGSTTYAVGSEPDTTANKANFYVYLDGAWTCIGTLPFETQNSASGRNNRYDAVIDTADVLELVNSALETNYDYNDFDFVSSMYETYSFETSNLGMTQTTATIAYNFRSSYLTRTRYVRLIPPGVNSTSTAFSFYTVTLDYPEGHIETHYVRGNSTFTFPAGYEWADASGNIYTAGESITITRRSTFTGTKLGPITEVHLNYDVNYPSISDATTNPKPTLAGLSVTQITDSFDENSAATLRNVSQQTVRAKVNDNTTGLSRIVQFKGWRIEDTDVLLSPFATLVWEELIQYQDRGAINLIGEWETDEYLTATFFIRFDSVAVDTEGNVTGQDQEKYTQELFAAYVGGMDLSKSESALHTLHHIVDESEDNSYTADKSIRALYGGTGVNGAWLSAFPADDFIFEELEQYAQTGYLSVDGETVAVEDLNDQNYAIRWYVFKLQSDAWHIDGKLVKKTGRLYVEKTFNGNASLIEQAKQGFYVEARNENTGATQRFTLADATESNGVYRWRVDNIQYNEPWIISEHTGLEQIEGAGVEFDVYSEYTIIDPLGDQSASGAGTSFRYLGRTQAVDEGDDVVPRAQFNNIYHRSNSIILKKQDYRTGAALSGAEFSLLQNGQPLTFTYNAETGSYIYDAQNGTETVLSGHDTGYFEIMIEEFSYDNGAITIEEVTAPPGYTSVAAIEIGYVDDSGTIGILSQENEMIRYENGVLLIGNSTDTVSVTAEKHWECPVSEWQPVQVQLMANDKIASAMIDGIEARVTLSADTDWKHSWQELPLYANGEKIVWSIKELMVGTEAAKADGSFVNWLASYDPPITTTDEQGNPHVLLAVNNTVKRVMLRLTKTDVSRTTHLAGAVFQLEAVDAEGNLLANEVVKTGTTDAAGVLIFDNIKVGVRYRLTEITAPEGYRVAPMPIYCTIGEDGLVQVEEHLLAESGSTAYNILIRNALDVPLPESGGGGTLWYFACGLLLMAAAGLYIFIFQKKGRWV